ncbi:MAG TPA: hypothetical protein VJ802_14600 [Gemmatimonadaceae bacterium]|nr:hypothetical protein [Gemmatimonadaceae bacterium]
MALVGHPRVAGSAILRSPNSLRCLIPSRDAGATVRLEADALRDVLVVEGSALPANTCMPRAMTPVERRSAAPGHLKSLALVPEVR